MKYRKLAGGTGPVYGYVREGGVGVIEIIGHTDNGYVSADGVEYHQNLVIAPTGYQIDCFKDKLKMDADQNCSLDLFLLKDNPLQELIDFKDNECFRAIERNYHLAVNYAYHLEREVEELRAKILELGGEIPCK